MLGITLGLVLLAAGGELRVGMDTRSRPWAFLPGLDYSAEDFAKPPRISAAQIEKLAGVEVEILAALAQRLGMATSIVPVAWEDIEQGLIDNRYDVIMNAWVPSSKTPKPIVASSPYYEWGLVVVVRADDAGLRSFADLAGKTVGHFRDPAVDRSVISLRAGRLVPFDDSDQLFEALAQGKLDAAVEDSTYARWRVAQDDSFRVVGEPLNRLGYHLGLRRSDTEMLVRVEAAIKDLRASPQLAAIRKRWEAPRAGVR